VFPRWLLSKLDLWDKETVLLNRTTITYRQLTIPCCTQCNTIHLSKMEGLVRKAVSKGAPALSVLDPIVLYQWLGKIFYGLLYRELSLAYDRKDPDQGSIASPELMEDYRALHGFLQSIRTPISFANFFPGSIFVFDLHEDPGFGDFDYSDNFLGMTFAIRMGKVGIVSCLKDNGAIAEELSDLYERMRTGRIHLVQFDEFSAVVFYRAFSIRKQSTFLSFSGKDQVHQILNLPGLNLLPYFDDWDFDLLSLFLGQFWEKYGITMDDIRKEPGKVMTFLKEFTE
jgi:hypothetical protein